MPMELFSSKWDGWRHSDGRFCVIVNFNLVSIQTPAQLFSRSRYKYAAAVMTDEHNWWDM